MRRSIMMVAVLAASTIGGARAGVIITSALNGGAPTGPSIDVLTFNASPLGQASQTFVTPGPTVTLSFSGDGGIVAGNLANYYAEPYSSPTGPDTTNYVTTGIGSATLAFSSAQTYFGLLWGSVDGYNSLDFYDANNQLITAFTGLDVTALADGNQGFQGTYYVNFSSDIAFTKVVASSSNYAFEFDDVAVDPPAVAEPATAAMLGVGLVLLAAVRRRASIGPSRRAVLAALPHQTT